jgi:3',5'-cyclic AMP phosphodiesterase CpdA
VRSRTVHAVCVPPKRGVAGSLPGTHSEGRDPWFWFQEVPRLSAEIRFAHLSDWHATTLVGGGAARFRGKRLSGWASWALKRRRHHDPRILEAAFRDVHAQSIDRILVTGDLTHISLESEFRAAARQLEALGSPERVFLIPGTHDCYVSQPASVSWDHWAAYLSGDPHSSLDQGLAACLASPPVGGFAPRYEGYPTLRVSGRLATIGLCSSIPTPIFRAGGMLGADQLDRLERLLTLLGDRGMCRVVMVHHPVSAKGEPTRRALWDGEALRGVLTRVGAELVLHGHKHRRRVNLVPGPVGLVPIIGVPSSSEVGSKPEKHAQYHVYTVRESDGSGPSAFKLCAEIRGYDSASDEFVLVDEELF